MDMEMQELVPGMLTTGLTIVYGLPNDTSSALLLHLAHALATGTEFCGAPTCKSKVLYVSLEDAETPTQKRVRQMRKRGGVEFDIVHKRQVSLVGYDVVLIIPPDYDHGEQASTDWQEDYNMARELSIQANANNAAVIIAAGPAGEDIALAGSYAGADTCWDCHLNSDGTVDITVRSSDFAEGEYTVH